MIFVGSALADFTARTETAAYLYVIDKHSMMRSIADDAVFQMMRQLTRLISDDVWYMLR